jgi:hypothetical protein
LKHECTYHRYSSIAIDPVLLLYQVINYSVQICELTEHAVKLAMLLTLVSTSTHRTGAWYLSRQPLDTSGNGQLLEVVAGHGQSPELDFGEQYYGGMKGQCRRQGICMV